MDEEHGIRFDDAMLRVLIVEFLRDSELAFDVADKPKFQAILQYLKPTITIPSSQELSKLNVKECKTFKVLDPQPFYGSFSFKRAALASKWAFLSSKPDAEPTSALLALEIEDLSEEVEIEDFPKPVVIGNLPKQIEIEDLPKPVGIEGFSKPVETGDFPKTVEIEDSSKPVETGSLPKPVEIQNLPKPVETGDFPKPVEIGNLPKPVEIEDLPKPVEIEDLPKPVEIGNLPKPVEKEDLPKAVVSKQDDLSENVFEQLGIENWPGTSLEVWEIEQELNRDKTPPPPVFREPLPVAPAPEVVTKLCFVCRKRKEVQRVRTVADHDALLMMFLCVEDGFYSFETARETAKSTYIFNCCTSHINSLHESALRHLNLTDPEADLIPANPAIARADYMVKIIRDPECQEKESTKGQLYMFCRKVKKFLETYRRWN